MSNIDRYNMEKARLYEATPNLFRDIQNIIVKYIYLGSFYYNDPLPNDPEVLDLIKLRSGWNCYGQNIPENRAERQKLRTRIEKIVEKYNFHFSNYYLRDLYYDGKLY